MKVRNNKLVSDNGTNVPFDQTPNRSPGVIINPEYLVIHYTAGGSLSGTVSHFNNPDADASAHLVIGHDGSIVQMGAFNQKLWHAGRSRLNGLTGFNGFSIGIEVVNWGKLSGGPGNWRSWVGTRVPDERVVQARHKLDSSASGWEVFDEEQHGVTVSAAKAICSHYGIPRNKLIGHDDISGYRGKRDPGPVFELERFRELVFGRSDDGDATDGLFVVTAQNGLNIRSGPGIEHPILDTLALGTNVAFTETSGNWWLVSSIDNAGHEDKTGWAHSRWLETV